ASKPVIVGSGLNPWNAEKLLSLADGAIVGTYFKAGGKLSNPVDIDRVKKLMTLVKRLRQITQGRGL
ncbi:MAG: BtpA/SgcQ family protein, partial [Candidatus Caldarchaeum sp.]